MIEVIYIYILYIYIYIYYIGESVTPGFHAICIHQKERERVIQKRPINMINIVNLLFEKRVGD